jgi:hypothetical protein
MSNPSDSRKVDSIAAKSVTEVTRVLKGVSFPTDKQGLLKTAKDNGASAETIQAMEQNLPGSGQYRGMADVTHNFGKASAA